MDDKKRVILHLDMDHFYTAIEEREQPAIKGRPVIVGADPKEGKGRGVVQTCNYEARKLNIRSGMPISRAWRLCPEATYLQPDFTLYIKVSDEIMSIARKYGDKFEQWGIDEAFLDVTSKAKDFAEAEALAKRIKEEILEKEGLTCSIGIGPNKLIAKIASDYQKPDGLTTVKEEDARTFLAPLPVRKLLWVGRKTEQKLAEMGIKTIGDLASYDPSILTENFGVTGRQLFTMANGMDKSEVQERSETKSISREITFEEDTPDPQLVLTTLDKLSEQVHEDALNQGFYFRTVTIKVRYENFETHTHSKSLPFMSSQLRDLTEASRELMWHYLKPERRIRLIGVRASNLESTQKQKTLF